MRAAHACDAPQLEFFAEEELITVVPNPNFYDRAEDDPYIQCAGVRGGTCQPAMAVATCHRQAVAGARDASVPPV